MTLGELLLKNQDAIVGRWLDHVLAAYGADSSTVFKRQKDPFANPVGHSLRVGTRGIFEALLRGMDVEKIRQYLHEIVKIRAVQQFSASEAVGFVFYLKEAVRAELADAAKDPRFSDELAQLDRRIDRVALAAFDLFVQCREQVCELRVNELKRRVSWVMDKMSQHGLDSQPAPDQSGDCDSQIRDVTVHAPECSRHTPCADRQVSVEADQCDCPADGTRSVPATIPCERVLRDSQICSRPESVGGSR